MAQTEIMSFGDPVLAQSLFGPLNANLQMVSEATGAELDNRGSNLSIGHETPHVREILLNLFTQAYGLLKSGTPLNGEDLVQGFEILSKDSRADLGQIFRKNGFIVTGRKNILPRNAAQRAYMDLLRSHEMVLAVGPAGTGKTYLAVAMALAMLAEKKVKRIVLTRPAVEAGERLGFLPGDMEEKVNPYLRPLYDAMSDMLGPANLAVKQETGVIEVAPLAFMRGRTLNNAFLILDEAQNTTPEQMKMFLTRLGFGSRAVITGDITQIDLPRLVHPNPGQNEKSNMSRSGLVHALGVLAGVSDIAFHYFDARDVVRHPLVSRIVDAYEKFEAGGPENGNVARVSQER